MTSEDTIHTILTEIQGMKDLMAGMTGIPSSITFMNEQFESTMKELRETRKELDEAKKEKENLYKTINTMQTTIANLEIKVNGLANQQLTNNLEISGVPVKQNENCTDIAVKIAQKVHPQMKRDEISEAYRIGRATNEEGNINENRAMVVKFKSVATRNVIYKQKKVLKDVNTTDFGIGSVKRRIYITCVIVHS